jgi:hypothetical protein
MGDVKAATVGAANITSLFSKAQSAAGKLKATDVIANTIRAGRDLREFRVTVTQNIVEPLASAGQAVDGFRDIVAKTRVFIENLKSLRALGLDPQLFNQLVQAGVEAGGETAQALVDGGSETITELNGLFGELNELGAELGEETAQVMFGAGVDLTNGIIAGIAAEQAGLEEQASILAEAFELVFSTELEAGLQSVLSAIKQRMDEAKAELARILAEMEAAKAQANRAAEQAQTIVVAPPAPTPFPAPAPSTGGGGGGGGGTTGAVKMPIKTPTPAELIALPIKDIKAPLTPEMQKIVAGDKKGATTININVKTDPTKSTSQVGKDITKTLDDYLKSGGKPASGGGGGGFKFL